MREKLIELLITADDYEDSVCKGYACETCPYHGIDCNYKARADHLIANGVTIQKWIPVTERLPEQSGKYIVCSKRKIKVGNWERMEKKVYQAKYYVYPTGCHWGQRDKGKHITHWMPMPEVPKGE